ncbi:MAG: hypothetical protein AAGG01_19740, partial [Planctomycetota bacterium]
TVDRPAQIAGELAIALASREELSVELGNDDRSGGLDPAVREAIQVRDQARLTALASRAAELRVEETTYAARRDVISARLRLARALEASRELELRHVEVALNLAREKTARDEQIEAEAAVEDAAMEGAAFADLAAKTLAARQETLELTRELAVDRARIQALAARENGLEARLDRTRERIEIAGLSKDTGVHLRRERQRLIESRMTRADAAADDERRIEIELARFESETDLNEALEDAALIPWLVEAAAQEGRFGQEVERVAQELRDDYIDALDAKLKVLQDRSQQLLELTSLRTAMLDSQRAYEAFVAERILWIRSSEPLWRVGPDDIAEELGRVVLPASPGEIYDHASKEVARRPLVTSIIGIGLVVLLAARLRVRKALADEGELARQRSQVSIAPTLRATVLSLLIAAPYAAVLYVVSWLSATTIVDSDVTRALSTACLRAAGAALIIGALRALTTKDGLEEAHFNADPGAVKLVRRQTTWLLPLMPTAALVGEFLASLDAGSAANSLARLAFLVEVGSLLVFTWRVLSPKRGVLALNVRASGTDDLLTRTRRFWFVLAVTTLALLGVLTVIGYGFTARSLFGRFELTIGLVLLLVTLRSIALRWIKLIRRREALEKLRKKREELREKRLAEIERRRNAGEDVGELESQGLEVEEEEVNLATISTDLKRLIRMVTVVAAIGGAYWIWSSVMPALGAFERVELWEREVSIKGADGALTRTVESVTLASLGLALLILLATWRAVKDLPALVEIVLLQRLEL